MYLWVINSSLWLSCPFFFNLSQLCFSCSYYLHIIPAYTGVAFLPHEAVLSLSQHQEARFPCFPYLARYHLLSGPPYLLFPLPRTLFLPSFPERHSPLVQTAKSLLLQLAWALYRVLPLVNICSLYSNQFLRSPVQLQACFVPTVGGMLPKNKVLV